MPDLREQRQLEEVPETQLDGARERQPRLLPNIDVILVLEQRERLRPLAIHTGLRGAPLRAHALDRVADERLDGDLDALAIRVERHLDRVVDDAPRPHLARRELLEDVEPAHVGGRVARPAAPRAVVLVEVAALALLEGAVPASRPGEVVGQVGHARILRHSAARGVLVPAVTAMIRSPRPRGGSV